ncbi:MAG: VOC family protein [Bacillota bacterium]
MKINPYLNFEGKAEEAFEFYKSVFGGEFSRIQRYSETPEAGEVKKEDQNKIMHVSLPVGDAILMASDSVDSMGQKLLTGNNISLSIDTGSKEEADQLFKALSEGGKVDMPMDNSFWGSYFGMATDRFGIHWMISWDKDRM